MEMKRNIIPFGRAKRSVKEVIDTCEKVTGRKANVVIADRRAGDPARLVASADKIHQALGWKAERDLEEIIASAWKWHKCLK